MDEDSDDYETLEPERDAPDLEEFENAPWDPSAQLHAEIKAQAEIPANPTYLKLFRSCVTPRVSAEILVEAVP